MKKPLQLLICEDEESDAAMVIRALEKAGYDVIFHRVETAEDMRTALEKQEWDVIISDYNIPGFGGPQALAILKSAGIDIPFILVSGTIGEEVAVLIMKAGANDYLMKDRLTRLSEVVKKEMEETEKRKEVKAVSEMIKANEEKYHAVINNSRLAIFLARPGGLILESNTAATELFGYDAEEFTRLDRNDVLDMSDPQVLLKLSERDRNGSIHGECIGIKKNGERFYCEVSSIIFKDINGQKMSCSMLADISARKNAEQQILDTNIELKKLSTHLKNAREDERKYISREIHDQLGQLASAIKIELDWLNIHLEGAEQKTSTHIEHALSITKVLIDTTRKIATALRPSILDELGLSDSLKWQCSEFKNMSGIPCDFKGNFDDTGISLEIRTELFRICQESLTNVMRHAQASKVSISLSDSEENMELSVTDDGKGFDPNTKSDHIGLVGLRERVLSINARLMIKSKPGHGTTILVVVPKDKLYI